MYKGDFSVLSVWEGSVGLPSFLLAPPFIAVLKSNGGKRK
jgi:hypothetical protein